ncbi:RICIN domain-containing protein [Streptomyces triculaminicus]|uniref:RICIN domain-containing protein n=1 Tax=Streptomyces triculaminicus TaxID=2816232 RepID=UPI0037D56EB0
MKKRVVGNVATAAAIASLAVIGTSGEAHADGHVKWQNAKTGMCLQETGEGVRTGNCNNEFATWYEKNLFGSVYRIKLTNGSEYCLDSNKSGSVYVLPCKKDNPNQMWAESKTSTGWRLTNYATNRVLDSNWAGSAYTNFDEGDSNRFQRWK